MKFVQKMIDLLGAEGFETQDSNFRFRNRGESYIITGVSMTGVGYETITGSYKNKLDLESYDNIPLEGVSIRRSLIGGRTITIDTGGN